MTKVQVLPATKTLKKPMGFRPSVVYFRVEVMNANVDVPLLVTSHDILFMGRSIES